METLSTRVTRLISGSINSLVDKAEELAPEMVMKESIREVDSMINEIKVLLGKENVKEKTIQNQLENEQKKYKNLTEQIQIAIDENRDDLAKTAISRQMDIESQIPILEESLIETEENIVKLENYIDALNAKKREMQEELQDFIKINSEQKQQKAIDDNMQKADAVFERLNSKTNTDLVDDAKLAELNKLSRDNRIAERLQSLKASK